MSVIRNARSWKIAGLVTVIGLVVLAFPATAAVVSMSCGVSAPSVQHEKVPAPEHGAGGPIVYR